MYTVDLVILSCLNFREFLILGLFTKLRIHEFSFFFSDAIIKIIFAIFLISRISARENQNPTHITLSTVLYLFIR